MVTEVAANKLQMALREVRSLRTDAAPSAVKTAERLPLGGNIAANEVADEAIPTIDAADLRTAVADISRSVSNIQRSLEFSVDEDSGRTIITVVDRETKQVIRQIPPKEILAIAKRIDHAAGILLEAHA